MDSVLRIRQKMNLMDVKRVYLPCRVHDSPVLHRPNLHTQHRLIIHREFSSVDVETALIFRESDCEIGPTELKLLYFLARQFLVDCWAGSAWKVAYRRIGVCRANICDDHGGIRIAVSSSVHAPCT